MSRAALSARFLLVFALAQLAFALAAPAPVPRPRRHDGGPPPHAVLVYHSGRWLAYFGPSGSYRAVSPRGGPAWSGRWERDGATVTVREGVEGREPTLGWSFTLGDRDGPIRLEPPGTPQGD